MREVATINVEVKVYDMCNGTDKAFVKVESNRLDSDNNEFMLLTGVMRHDEGEVTQGHWNRYRHAKNLRAEYQLNISKLNKDCLPLVDENEFTLEINAEVDKNQAIKLKSLPLHYNEIQLIVDQFQAARADVLRVGILRDQKFTLKKEEKEEDERWGVWG